MSRPSVGSSSTSNFASIAITSARCNCVTIPFDNCRTLLVGLISVRARKPSALVRSNFGCTPWTQSSKCVTPIQRGKTATSAMNDTSRIKSSREFHGSRPSTLSSPSYEVSPRIALSAVVLPAPLGPINPRIRPSSTRRSTLSKATVVPKTLRSLCASITAIASFSFHQFAKTPLCRGNKFSPRQTEPLNLRRNAWPFFRQKFLPFAFQQQFARTSFDEHPEAAFHLDQILINQLLISLQHRKRIDPVLSRHIAD